MIFITDADITDDVLVVDQSDIDAANAYVGSVQAKFAIADEDIADPLPYNIRRLAIVYACYTAALDAVGTDATETMGENRQRIDIYEQKRKAYYAELTALSGSITAAAFTGTAVGGSPKVTLGRS